MHAAENDINRKENQTKKTIEKKLHLHLEISTEK